MRSESGNRLCFTLKSILFLGLAIGTVACPATNKFAEPSSPPAEPKLTRSVSLATVDGELELLPPGKDLPAIASQRLIYDKDERDAATITIFQTAGSLRETIAEVDVPVTPMKDSSIVITVSIDSDKQLRLKTSVMETAIVKEFGPFPVE